METIANVRVRLIDVPLDDPVWLGGYSVTNREYGFVEIETSEGRVGHALGYTRGGDLPGAVLKNVAPLLVGKDPDQIEALWEAVWLGNRMNGRQGLLMRALSLADLALWDLKGKKAGQPLYRLLGGYRETIPVLMAGGYYGPGKGLKELCEEYERYVDQGYRHLKLMVGNATMEEDFRRFVAVRKSLPKEVSLAVDVNGNWPDPKAVLRWIERAEKEGCEIAFVEEPFPPEHMEGYRFLRERSSVPIAFGEFMAGRWEFRRMMEQGCLDIVRADATLCGGITEWRRIAALASAWNMRIIPHYFAYIHLNVGLAFPGTEMIEVVTTKGKVSSLKYLIGENFELKDGIAHPKHLPGLGFAIDEAFMDRHTIGQASYR